MPWRQLFKDMRVLQHLMRNFEHHLAVVTLLAHDRIQEVDIPLQEFHGIDVTGRYWIGKRISSSHVRRG